MKTLNKNELKSALFFAKEKKNSYYKVQESNKSELLTAINNASNLKEDELTKKGLFDILSKMFTYMRSYNMYVYYRNQVTSLLVKLEELEDGNIRDENR